jgi:succinyl-CoA synthetase beta subunit
MGSTLSERASLDLVARYGVPTVPVRRATTPDEAVTAAAELGGPVVVKLHGDGIAHKTERGLVRLDLATPDAVRDAATSLLAAGGPPPPAGGPGGGAVDLVVAPMVVGSRELIAGMHTDAQFGRCVMIGIGGILTEAQGDVAFRLAPLTEFDAVDMLDELRDQALLGPVRGEPAVDRDAVGTILLSLARLAAAEPEVRSVDVNPLVIVDGRPVAVDALVERV